MSVANALGMQLKVPRSLFLSYPDDWLMVKACSIKSQTLYAWSRISSKPLVTVATRCSEHPKLVIEWKV